MTDILEPQVAQLNIGELLSNQRRQNNETPKEIATTVRLSAEVIEKLEANRFSEVGTPVYVRGYLGIYAKYLGLDAAFIIEQYNLQYPVEAIVLRESLGQASGALRQQRIRHSKTVSFIVASLVFSGLAYAYFQTESYWKKTNERSDNTQIEQPNNNTSSMTNIIGEATNVESFANDVLAGDSTQSTSSLITNIDLDVDTPSTNGLETNLINIETTIEQSTSEGTQSGNSTTSNTLTTEVGLPTVSLESTGNQDNQPSETSTTADQSAALTQTAPITEKIVTLKMSFTKECWIQVTDANKKTLTARVYQPKSTLEVSGKPPLTIITARPSAITSITYNAQKITLADYKIKAKRYQLPKTL